MAMIVLEHVLAEKRYEEAVEIGDVILEAHPNLVDAILKQGTAYAYLIDVKFRAIYPTPNDIPRSLRPQYLMFAEKNQAAFERAEALGWRE